MNQKAFNMGKAIATEPDLASGVSQKRKTKEGLFVALGAGIALIVDNIVHFVIKKKAAPTANRRMI